MEESDAGPLCRKKKDKNVESNRKGKTVKTALFLLFAVLAAASFYLFLQWKAISIADSEIKKQYFALSETIGEFWREKTTKKSDLPVGERAFPVKLIVDGEKRQVWTHARNVAALLQEANLYPGVEDIVIPAMDKFLFPQQTVKITRVIKEIQSEKEIVPFNTIRVASTLLDQGQVRVAREGSAGIRENIYESVKCNGKEISKEIISSRITKEPIEKILEYGVDISFSRSGRAHDLEKVIEVSATAYCPGTPGSGCPIDERGASLCTGFNNDGYTCTGLKAIAGKGTLEKPHIVAVDPQIIPLKSLIFIEGYGFARAEDTGSAIKGSSIDLLFDKHHDACLFGRKTLKVYLLKK
ncbi:MAG: DUF348 domain-containing protein [Firmicutes bacterium]|nr:DUF348 domain-containing protein [Bacillota bacterium]